MENKFNKFLTLLTILLFGFGQMWGAERQIPTTVLTLPTTGLSSTWSSSFTASHYYYHDNTNHYVIYYPYAVRMSKSTQTWVADDGGGSTEISDGYSSTGIFKGFTYFNALDGSSKKRCDKLGKSTGTIVTYRVTNCTAVSAYIKLGKKKDVVHLKCYVMTEDIPAESAAKSDSYTDASSASTGILNLTGLDAKKEYLVEIYNAGGGSNAQFYEIAFYYPVYTVTYDLNGGTGTTPTEDDQPLGAKFDLHDGVTGIIPPTGQEFLKWKDQDDDEYDGGDEYTMPAKNVTLTAQWGTAAPKYDITFNNGGHGTAPSATNASKVTLAELSASGWVHTGWVADQTVTVDEADVTAGTKIANGKTAHLSANTEFTAQWSQLYAITEGTPSNGSVDADVAEAVAGATVTITATPATDYLLDAWDVYKTGESGTKVSVTETAGVYTFAMPAYAVTVSATFKADTRPKVLYVTKNNEATTKSSDKLYEALKDDYNVKIVGAAAEVTYTDYALVVLHESVDGSNHNAAAVSPAKTTSVPVLNTKSYFYTSGSSARWGWGTPDAGKSVNGATQNSTYSNIASHPIFAGVTVTAGFVQITDEAANKCMQPVKTITTGYEGYTLATTPNSDSGNGTAIHEIPAGTAARGVSSGRYLMISVSGDKLGALNANGQKLFQNAADYLINGTAWEPEVAPTLSSSVPANNATDVAVEGDIVLTFSQNVSVLDASKFTLSGGAGSLTTASISVSGAVVTIPYTGLDNSTEYTLATAAGAVKNGSDVPNAALSNIVFTTEAACTKPTAPVSLAASNITHTSADLSWDPLSPGANGYKISIIKKDDETVILDWTDEATNSYKATGLTQGTTYTLKVKYKGTGAQCEFSNEVTLDFTTTAPSVADLVTIADDYTFTPSATIAAGTLAESNKFFGAGTDDCDYGSGMRVKENRALAFKVNNGARVKVTFTTNGDREMQLGTDKADDDNKAYGHTKTSPATFDVTADGVVYLTASSDLRFSKLEIMYPHTVTYDLNGGTGTTPTQASKYVGETFSVHDGVTDITAPASKDFDKWVDQDAAEVAAGATYTMPAKNVTLTAQWVDHIEPVDPTLTYDDGAYSVGGSALDLSTLITAQTSTGAITYSVKTDGGTSASIDGNNFTATAAGTATITASQAAVVGFNAKTVDFNVVVTEPAEKDGIKMVVAGALTGHFRVKADQLKTGSYTVDGINYTKYVQMGSTHTSFSGETEGNQAKGIYYAPAKKNIKFWFYMRNTDSSTRKIYIYKMEEGSAITSATVDVDPGSQLVSYDMTLATNAEVIFGVENTKLYFCQIVAVESGEDLLQGGQNGYVFDYSMKRQNVAATTLRTIDGIDYYLSAESKINSASNVQLTTLGTHYIKFHLDAPMTVNVYADNKKYYVGTECSTEDAAMTYEATGDGEFTLAAGNWYINGSGAQVKINKLSFMLPKCEQPTITTQPATNVTFGAGNLTATVVAEVSDGGTLSYQWYNASDDSEVTGADEATLTTTTEGTYYVIVTNSLADHQDNSIKSNDATLGYRTLNDATLSALSYGDPATAIALEADKYEYRVILNEGTVDVPALHATATMDPYPTVDITDATSFTDYTAQSTVRVTAEDGVTELTYIVNFIVKHIYTSLEDVTASTTWNWTGSVNQSIDDVPNKGVIIANYIEGDNFEMIEGKAGEYARRTQNDGVYQGTYLHFNTTVPGRVKFYFRAPSGGENCTITVKNGGRTVVAGTRGNSFGWSDEVFVNGDVVVEMVNDKEGGGTTRVQQVVFTTVGPDYTRDMTEGRFGTICLPQAGVMVGATLYEIAYYGATSEKIFLDDIPSGEMEAGVPYVFLPNDGVSTLGVFYTDDEVLAATNHNGLYGYIGASEDDYYTIPDGVGNYIIQNNCYREVQAGAWARIKSNRAYIHLADITPTAPMLAPGRHRLSIGINAPQVTTGLDELNVGDTPVKVMIDGNLYILRGENMYDATGRLVK